MLSKRTADITRSTVQKSVCLLSNLPLYGHVQVKMGLITEAYFREGDFTQYSLLQDAYKNLNMCLSRELLNSTQALIGCMKLEVLLDMKFYVDLIFVQDYLYGNLCRGFSTKLLYFSNLFYFRKECFSFTHL